MSTPRNASEMAAKRGSFWALLLTSFTVVVGVSLSAGLVWATPPQTICAGIGDQRIAQDPANYRPLTELPRMVQGAQVILLAEVHRTHYAFREPLMKLLRQTRKGRACQFYELDREMTIREHIRNFRQPGFEEVAHHIDRVHQLAKGLGLKEFTVDTESSPEDTSVTEVNRRDREMAREIARLMRTECDSAIMFVGKAHVVNEKPHRQNLNIMLGRQKIATKVINLQDPNDDRMTELWGDYDAKVVQSWNGVCKKGASLPRPEKPVIFLSGKFDGSRLVWPRTRELARWSSFDFTILAPDPDLESTLED